MAMALNIISRSAAGLPPVPSSVGFRSLASWRGIRIHHTGGPFSSWRAIHDWQTTGRPADGSLGARLVYIGYSFGIANGRVTELRGWDRSPAHDFINTHLGVVFGGNYETSLPPAADLQALVDFIREADRRSINTAVSTHREVGGTSCPGTRLHNWIKSSLPDRLEDDMPTAAEVADAVIAKLTRTTNKTHRAYKLGVAAEGERMHPSILLQYGGAFPEYLVDQWQAIMPGLRGDVAQTRAQVAGLIAAFEALAAGGTSVDTAAVIARIEQVALDLGARVTGLEQALAAAEHERDALRERLADALTAADGGG